MKEIIKTILRHPFVIKILAFLGALYIKFCFYTSRWSFHDYHHIDNVLEEKKPLIIAFWHGQMAMLPCAWRRKEKVSMLLSAHRDGQMIAEVLKHFNIDVIVGSSTRGGGAAYLAMIKFLKGGGVVGITPDGPRGPNGYVAPGIVALAQETNALIIPVSYAMKRCKKLRTWDQFIFPYPFSCGVFVIGHPINLTLEQRDKGREYVKHALDEVTCHAHNLIS